MTHQLANILYKAGAQHNVTMSDNGRKRNWMGSKAREKKNRKKRSEAAWWRSWEAKQRMRQKRLRTF